MSCSAKLLCQLADTLACLMAGQLEVDDRATSQLVTQHGRLIHWAVSFDFLVW